MEEISREALTSKILQGIDKRRRSYVVLVNEDEREKVIKTQRSLRRRIPKLLERELAFRHQIDYLVSERIIIEAKINALNHKLY